jgi:hypothetical protein
MPRRSLMLAQTVLFNHRGRQSEEPRRAFHAVGQGSPTPPLCMRMACNRDPYRAIAPSMRTTVVRDHRQGARGSSAAARSSPCSWQHSALQWTARRGA